MAFIDYVYSESRKITEKRLNRIKEDTEKAKEEHGTMFERLYEMFDGIENMKS